MIKDILKNLFHVSTYLEQDTNERIWIFMKMDLVDANIESGAYYHWLSGIRSDILHMKTGLVAVWLQVDIPKIFLSFPLVGYYFVIC